MTYPPFDDSAVRRAAELWRCRQTEDVGGDLQQFAVLLGVTEEDLRRRLLADEFLERWRQGELLPVELFLSQHVRFRGDVELILALIGIEMAFMEAEPSESCYCEERFPHLAARIKDLFVAYRKDRKSFHPILDVVCEEGESSAFSEFDTLQSSLLNETLKSIAAGKEERGDKSIDVEGAVDSVVLHEAYVVKEEIGHGASKLVFEAKQRSTRQTVALKTLREKHLAGQGDESEREAFIREARTQTLFGHQSIPPVFSLGEDAQGRPFFVEKHIRGIPWSDRIEQYGLDENLRILDRVATAVGYVHQEHRVIHRDLKPANVKIDEEYSEVYVVDWGSALHIGEVEDEQHPTLHVSRAKHCRATPAYMPPEAAVGTSEKCSTATDVFMLGAVLYEILTGEAPYASAIKETGDPVLAVVQAAAVKKHPPLRDNCRYPDVAEDLFVIVDLAMEYKQEDRYPDAIAFAEALNSYRKYSEAMRSCARASRSFQEASAPDSEELGDLKNRRAMRMIEIAEQYCGIQEMLVGDESSAAFQRALNEEFAVRETLASLCLDIGDLGIATEELGRLDALLPKVQRQDERRDDLARLRERQERKFAVRRRLVAFKWVAAALVVCLTASMIGMAFWRNQANESRERLEIAEIKTETADKLARSAQQRSNEIEREARKQVAATHAAGRFIAEAATHGREIRPQWETYYLAQSLIENDLPSTRAAISESLQHSLVVVESYCFPDIEAYELARVFSSGYDPLSGLLIADGNEADSTFRVWRTTSERGRALFPMSTNGREEAVFAYAIVVQSGGERFVTACSDGCVRIWATRSGACLKTIIPKSVDPLEVEEEESDASAVASSVCPPMIAIDHAGERLAVADGAHNISLWDMNQLEILCQWNTVVSSPREGETELEEEQPCSLLFAPNGQELLSITRGGELTFWDLNEKTPIPFATSSWLDMSPNEVVATCPNGLLFAIGSEQGLVSVWEWFSRKLVRIYRVGDEKNMKSDSRPESLGSMDADVSSVTDWSASDAPQRRMVASLAFSPDSRLLLTCAENGELLLFDLCEDVKLNHYTAPSVDSEYKRDSEGLDESPEGSESPEAFLDSYPFAYFANGGEIIQLLADGELHFLDYNAWPESTCVATRSNGVRQFAHSPSCDELCLLDEDLHPSRWAANTIEHLPEISEDVGAIEVLAYHPQEEMFLAATISGELLLVDRTTGFVERCVGDVWSVPQSRDGLEGELSLSVPRNIEPFPEDLVESPEVRMNSRRSASPITCVSIHPEGRLAVTNGPKVGFVYLWDLEECRCLRQVRIFESVVPIHSLAFHPRDAQLACGGRNGQVVFWDMHQGRDDREQQEPKQIAGVGAKRPLVRYSPDGRLLIQAGASDELTVWDAAIGEIVSMLSETVRDQSPSERQVMDVAFSRDSSMLATCGTDGCIRLWIIGSDDNLLPLFVISTVRLACQPFRRAVAGSLQEEDTVPLTLAPQVDGDLFSSPVGSPVGRPFRSLMEADAAGQSVADFPKILGAGPDLTVYGVCFSEDDEQLFAAHADGGLIVYDLKSIQEELERRPADIMESVQDQTGLRSSMKTISP